MMRNTLTAVMVKNEAVKNCLMEGLAVAIRRTLRICINTDNRRCPLAEEPYGNSIIRFNRTISLYLMESSLKHPDVTTTGQGQSYYRRKSLFPLRNLVSTNMLEDILSQILRKKKKNLRIPPHPTTKQRMLFLRRMGYPAQTLMNESEHIVTVIHEPDGK